MKLALKVAFFGFIEGALYTLLVSLVLSGLFLWVGWMMEAFE